MKSSKNIFCSSLEKLDPTKSDDLISDLYDITDILESKTSDSSVYEAIFNFFEQYPESDVGNPGPLVHLIEKSYPEYMPRLVSSIKHKPTCIALFMLSRVMNSKLPQEEWLQYLSLIKTVSLDENINEEISNCAKESYKYHYEQNT